MWLIDQLYIKLELQLSLSVSTDKHQNRIEFENSLDPTLETQPHLLKIGMGVDCFFESLWLLKMHRKWFYLD